MVKIFIGGLRAYANEDNLQKLFAEFGEVTECDILSEIGFVHMAKEEEAKAAISALHRTEFEGATMNVEMAKSQDRGRSGMKVRGGDRGGGRGGRGATRGDRRGSGFRREMNGSSRGGYGDRYDPYGPPPRRGRDPYDDPYRAAYARDPYARDPYARDPYARDPYARDRYARDPYARDPYARDPYARDPYARAPRDPYDELYARGPSRGRMY